jgi:hypothetical protein
MKTIYFWNMATLTPLLIMSRREADSISRSDKKNLSELNHLRAHVAIIDLVSRLLLFIGFQSLKCRICKIMKMDRILSAEKIGNRGQHLFPGGYFEDQFSLPALKRGSDFILFFSKKKKSSF